MVPILEVKNLTHTYSFGTPFEHKALDDVSLTVERGEFIGVIGHTGSGKSTLMQHLNGLLKPTAGQVLLDGVDIWSDKKLTRQARFRVGLVFQYPEYQLFEETVSADIAFGPKNMGLSEEEIAERVQDAMQFVGLDASCAQQSPFDLSGGQKRRVALAGVLAMRPEILVLDEPAAGLDPRGREQIFERICTYQRTTASTVLIVSHSMEDMASYCDEIVVMKHAKVCLQGTRKEIFSHLTELEASGLDLPQITRTCALLKQAGLPISDHLYTVPDAVAAVLEAFRMGKEQKRQ